jgi:hypothetical protein
VIDKGEHRFEPVLAHRSQKLMDFIAGEYGWDGSLEAAAFRSSKNSCPVLVGNPSVEWLTISVCTCSAKWNRMASPRGFAFGSVSGICGRPVELENRAVTGVESRTTCGARVNEEASEAGEKVPLSITPLA